MHGLLDGPRRRGRAAALAGIAALALQGCSVFAPRDAAPEVDLDRIAQNLVYTLVQLPETNPLTTTVQVADPVTPFGEEVVALIREAGYGIQSVPDDRGRNYLRYRVQRTASEIGTETRYAVSIGEVGVERAYETVDGRLLPVSEQRVSGSASRGIDTNDDLFDPTGEASLPSAALFDDELAPALADAATGTLTPIEIERDAPPPDSFGSRVKQNLYDGLSSNYAELFADYGDVDTVDISFPNDSMRLGHEQKRIIEGYAARLRPATDLLSVIGCSHGNTTITNGNSVLAIGRANRVKEALIYAGVPPEAVLDEGCWASGYHAVFPKRGVVLTLKRRLG